MRVYLAARYERLEEMERYGQQLRADGVEVTSTWHDCESPSSDGFNGLAISARALAAMLDVQQVAGSHALVIFSDAGNPDPRGGKHFEAGMALALGKRLLLVGPPENVFEFLPDVEHMAGWPECYARILELRESDALTVRQAADEAGVMRQDIHRAIKGGELAAAKDSRGCFVIPRNEVSLWTARRRRRAAEAMERQIALTQSATTFRKGVVKE